MVIADMSDAGVYQTIVFDLDGTLVDSAPDIMNALNTVLVDAGRRALSQQDVIGMIGDGIPTLVERGFQATGELPDPQDMRLQIERCLSVYSQTPCAHSTLYSGVAQGLDELHNRGVSMAVCTNKTESIARRVLVGLNIDGYFPVVVGGDTLSVKKPDAEHLHHTLRQLREHNTASPNGSQRSGERALSDSTLMVGDSYNDVLVANNAQVPAAFVTYGYNNTSIDTLDVAFSTDSFDELLAQLRPAQ